jgi:hypothetical protein
VNEGAAVGSEFESTVCIHACERPESDTVFLFHFRTKNNELLLLELSQAASLF